MQNALTNREIAALVWLGVGLIAALRVPSIRSSLRPLLQSLGDSHIVVLLVSFALYAGLVVGTGYEIGIWSPNMAKHTALWFLGPAIVLVLDVARVWEEERFFRTALRDTVAVTAAVAVLVNVCILPLAAELAMIPLLTLLGACSAFTAGRPQYHQAKSFVDGLLGIAGAALATCGVTRVIREWGHGG